MIIKYIVRFPILIFVVAMLISLMRGLSFDFASSKFNPASFIASFFLIIYYIFELQRASEKLRDHEMENLYNARRKLLALSNRIEESRETVSKEANRLETDMELSITSHQINSKIKEIKEIKEIKAEASSVKNELALSLGRNDDITNITTKSHEIFVSSAASVYIFWFNDAFILNFLKLIETTPIVSIFKVLP